LDELAKLAAQYKDTYASSNKQQQVRKPNEVKAFVKQDVGRMRERQIQLRQIKGNVLHAKRLVM